MSCWDVLVSLECALHVWMCFMCSFRVKISWKVLNMLRFLFVLETSEYDSLRAPQEAHKKDIKAVETRLGSVNRRAKLTPHFPIDAPSMGGVSQNLSWWYLCIKQWSAVTNDGAARRLIVLSMLSINGCPQLHVCALFV